MLRRPDFAKSRGTRWLNAIFVAIILLSAAKIVISSISPTAEIQTAGLPPRLEVTGVSWEHEKTVVLFLQSACKYCHQSVPFHREIAELANANGLGIVSVFPESVALARASLRALDLKIPAFEDDFTRIGVAGTPTLAIVDRGGNVISAWAGVLSEPQRREVLKSMGLLTSTVSRTSRPGPAGERLPIVLAHEAKELISDPNITVLDIRPRESYSQAHLKDAINIPRDELEIRAKHELAKSKKVLVFCQYLPECEKAQASAGLMTNCTIGAWFLRSEGFNAILLQSDISQMAKAGYALN